MPQLARRLEPRAAVRRAPSEDRQVTLHRNCNVEVVEVGEQCGARGPRQARPRRQIYVARDTVMLTKLITYSLMELLPASSSEIATRTLWR